MSDGSNFRELVIDYGLNSGQTLYGMDFAADLAGLKLRGEVSKNTLYRKYPIISGRSLRHDTQAWYLQAVRTFPRLRRLSLGAEFFHVGPRYGGGYDSRRGGVVLYTDTGGDGLSPMVAEFPLVDDNDDNDRYSDDNENDHPGSFDLEAGVYPGLDEDNDNIPDDDRNANGIPDYEEPFLLYHSDPQEFVYGLDLNNNGVIDVRENDNKPDYPYDRDRAAATTPLPCSLCRSWRWGRVTTASVRWPTPGAPSPPTCAPPILTPTPRGWRSSSTTTPSGSRIPSPIRSMSSIRPAS